MSASASRLKTLLPHMRHPVVGAPMAFVSGADLAVAVSRAQGLGFIAGGYDLPKLESELHRARSLLGTAQDSCGHNDDFPASPNLEQDAQVLPVGVGLIAWTSATAPDQARQLLRAILPHRPCALWLFAPASPGVEGYRFWVDAIHSETASSSASRKPVIFAQVSSVREALEAVQAGADVIVAQGADAGGHGAKIGAGLTSLVPEMRDALPAATPLLAAGGVMDGRGLASVLALGADGAALGTRFLASHEAGLPPEHQRRLLEAHDGGQSTVRTRLFDELRGTTGWPATYDGRALRNETVREWEAAEGGHRDSVDPAARARYAGAVEARDFDRLVVWAGTGVGLARDLRPAGEIVHEIVDECGRVLRQLHERWADSSTA